MDQRHQAYTLYYRNAYILVFFCVFVFFLVCFFFSLLRCILKSSVLRVGVKTLHYAIQYINPGEKKLTHCELSILFLQKGIVYCRVFQTFCCSCRETFNKCFRCSWVPVQWHKCLFCYNQIESWLWTSSQETSVSFGEPLAANRGTLRFRGTPVEKYW